MMFSTSPQLFTELAFRVRAPMRLSTPSARICPVIASVLRASTPADPSKVGPPAASLIERGGGADVRLDSGDHVEHPVGLVELGQGDSDPQRVGLGSAHQLELLGEPRADQSLEVVGHGLGVLLGEIPLLPTSTLRHTVPGSSSILL